MNLKSRQELIDYDYLKKLTPEEKAWLNKFTDEYVNDAVDRKDLSNNLHNTKALKKNCDDRNNARNRCILTQQKSMGKLNYIEELVESPISGEDEIIQKLDEDINS